MTVAFPTKIARGAGTGGSVPVECCQVCGNEKLETMLSLGYMPPVNQMVPIGQAPRQQPWFPTDGPLLRPLRTGAARPRGRSGDHLPAGISLHQRHDENSARQFRGALCRVVDDARPHQGRSLHRHRLQRRHADLELPEGRPPHPRHRADRRVEDRQRTRHPDLAGAISARTSRARSRRSTARPRSSPPPTALRISRTCTRSSRASSRCWRRTACSSRNRTI